MEFFLEHDKRGKYRLPKGIEVDKDYGEAIVKYVNVLDPIFCKAKKLKEFDFLITLLRLRGMSDCGWDPYETSLKTINDVMDLINLNKDNFELQINLSLWTYCHIIEASEPYEIVTNLLNICLGKGFTPCCYPTIPKSQSRNREKIFYPGDKIDNIKKLAKRANFSDISVIYNEVYDRDVRNAVFHSDYANDKRGLRIMKPAKSIPWNDVYRLVHRGIAYFICIRNLYRSYIASYTEPIVIPAPPGFSPNADEKIRIIIREGHGAVGFKTEASAEQILRGKIIARVGRFYADEIKLLEENPSIDILPRRS